MQYINVLRRFYESCIEYIACKCMCWTMGKQVFRKKVLKSSTFDDVIKVLNSSKDTIKALGRDVNALIPAMHFLYRFRDSKKFIISAGDVDGLIGNIESLFDLNDTCLIGSQNYLVEVVKLEEPIVLSKGCFAEYNIIAYDMSKANWDNRFVPVSGMFLDSNMHLNPYTFLFNEVISRNCLWSKKIKTELGIVGLIDVDGLASLSEEERVIALFSRNIIDAMEEILMDVLYAAYLWENRGSIFKKRSEAGKAYERKPMCVQMNHKDEDEEDVIIPLPVHTKRYEPSVIRGYKGGHHASPVEHTRRSYYRKSRGRGDYDLVDGKFIYVGRLMGHYTKVRACKVSGIKKTIMYKVQ